MILIGTARTSSIIMMSPRCHDRSWECLPFQARAVSQLEDKAKESQQRIEESAAELKHLQDALQTSEASGGQKLEGLGMSQH